MFLPTEVAEHGTVLVGCRGLSSQKKILLLACGAAEHEGHD